MKIGTKHREPIALRAKELKDGRKSLYLDYYQPGHKNHSHRYEFLRLYLLPETSKQERDQNRLIMQSAQAILSQRIIALANGKAGIKSNCSDLPLVVFMKHFSELKGKYGKSKARSEDVLKAIKHIEAYNSNVKLKDVDKAYCVGFIYYLTTAKSFRSSKTPVTLSKHTAAHYYDILVSVLNQAVKEELIEHNPADKVTKEVRRLITPKGSSKTYLSIEELQQLINTPVNSKEVHDAFLFACYCGLRISDIRTLRTAHVIKEGDRTFIQKKMVKTDDTVIVPLGAKALEYLPEPKLGRYFYLPSQTSVNETLRNWAKRAGINKDVSFHVSRHTFATTLLTKGADLYTVSKLLGHSDIQVTQVYAEIVNKKRVEAIDLLDSDI